MSSGCFTREGRWRGVVVTVEQVGVVGGAKGVWMGSLNVVGVNGKLLIGCRYL